MTEFEVDAETIRRSYEAVLYGSRPMTGEERERLGGLLLGHVQMLVPELAEAEPHMPDGQRSIAVHVLGRQVLLEGAGTSARDVWDLAVQCRALFIVLYQYPAPPRLRAAGGAAEGRS